MKKDGEEEYVIDREIETDRQTGRQKRARKQN